MRFVRSTAACSTTFHADLLLLVLNPNYIISAATALQAVTPLEVACLHFCDLRDGHHPSYPSACPFCLACCWHRLLYVLLLYFKPVNHNLYTNLPSTSPLDAVPTFHDFFRTRGVPCIMDACEIYLLQRSIPEAFSRQIERVLACYPRHLPHRVNNHRLLDSPNVRLVPRVAAPRSRR